MENKFKPGDVVQLKSGGPSMTVSQLPGKHGHVPRDSYVCQWFKGASKEQGAFVEEELQTYVNPAKA
ncbi:MAG: DUF2158 domain-containing protein [Rhodobacteraceae bacterium]|nr:MAG: DUF2158 domain-containing protein [Paracoccaceae bacterium]